MQNIDRLEVRGRDSAGISIQMLLSDSSSGKSSRDDGPLFQHRTENGTLITTISDENRPVVTFVYKVANLVGKLGDNTWALRNAIRNDFQLWKAAEKLQQINIIAHTRWASNGIISLSNCHPTDGRLSGDDHEDSKLDTAAQFVLNGDVDNYRELLNEYVLNRGLSIDNSITTDAKILPLLYRLGTKVTESPAARFAEVMNRCDGSLAIVMQHPLYPLMQIMAQKGSGQSLFVGKVTDGVITASEVYGLAARTRTSYALSGTEKNGSELVVSIDDLDKTSLTGKFLEDNSPFHTSPEPIYIHSRDIYRGTFNYYFEKEIHDAPASVTKTIRNKYRKIGSRVFFSGEGLDPFAQILTRLRDQSRPKIRRIIAIGQGTAAVAAQGAAFFIAKALTGTRTHVAAFKASEISGFLADEPLDDALIVAISQSGTTTDTNRTVDVASSQGAWIHSIVNRRNSPLISKSDSYFYTSDGRDVEMAVASTKAFYSQIAAGKLLALMLAQEFKSMSDEQILREIQDLERLPGQIANVLSQSDQIKQVAEKYGPTSRNWAVVGNGPNKIAADEIRIKLSELCYKSIPCDVTEDKKHIDLSTEPLTLVIANDLPDQIVQDTAKEVAIFKAHNGKPLVICSKGERRFDRYAEQLIELPTMGSGLGFVLATVAGHLWGFYTAKAIDSRADEFRSVRSLLTGILEKPDTWDPEQIRVRWQSLIRAISTGELNSSLPASTAGLMALYSPDLSSGGDDVVSAIEKAGKGIDILNRAIEEMTRPIDSIRHQAKTVTVGISRPQEVLPAILLYAFESLSVVPGYIKETDRRLLRLIAPLLKGVEGGLLYGVIRAVGEGPWIQVIRRSGVCAGKASRYDEPRPVAGSKRTAIRTEKTIWSSGPDGTENLLIIPLLEEASEEYIGICLLHVTFVANAPVKQKLSILRGLGERFHEMTERLEEVSSTLSLEEVLESISPRDMLLAPIDHLIPSLISAESKEAARVL
jgi:glucosamine--fructose-6-phosphate aminotransferase (isomerizing)